MRKLLKTKKAAVKKKAAPKKLQRSTKLKIKANDQKGFSQREQMIIRLICQQMSNVEISEKIKIARRTVDDYRNDILKKMKVKNTAGLVVYAIKKGIYKIR